MTAISTTGNRYCCHCKAFLGKSQLQRFFYTEKFYQPGSPIFLIIAGGWEESAANFATDYAAYFDYAESHRAVVYLLEHRYYGQSIPHGFVSAGRFSNNRF